MHLRRRRGRLFAAARQSDLDEGCTARTNRPPSLIRYVRPFGSSALIASYSPDGPQLFAVEPSGLSHRFFAAAIGASARPASCNPLKKSPAAGFFPTPHRRLPGPAGSPVPADGVRAACHVFEARAPPASPPPPVAAPPPHLPAQNTSFPVLPGRAASGKSKNAAKSALEKLDLSTLTAKEAVKEVAKILYAQHDPSKDKPLELELS